MLLDRLDQSTLTFWTENRYLVIRDALTAEQVNQLKNWTYDLEYRDETPGKWMKYFETGPDGRRQLCRVENFIPYHAGLRDWLAGEDTLAALSKLFDEEAVLFKEKINFKLPGGSGFKAHQDAPAFKIFGQTFHITMMLAVDAADEHNGCLEVAHAPSHRTLFEQDRDMTIAPSLAAGMSWTPISVQPGDVIFFDSYLPHRSSENRTQNARRALYVTYNGQSEGDVREAYFREKRRGFPPEVERDKNIDYEGIPSLFNVGNPIR